jgi:iron complex transport system substrate-binding protein
VTPERGPRVTRYPSRIVCLTEETTETLYLLGEGRRVVGISGYTVRPREARAKPRVSAFLTARFDKIDELQPDLVLGFSDLQAEIGAELVRRGYPVVVFNQRSVAEILQMVRMLGALVGVGRRADALASGLERDLDDLREAARRFQRRPRVYFEEWPDPLISGIRWVEELVEIAGGEPIFPELRQAKLGKDRIVSGAEVVRRNPDVIVASWCGKPVRKRVIADRQGWEDIAAVRNGQIHEIKSAYILQPGPASLTVGVQQLHEILRRAAVRVNSDPLTGP